MTECQPPPARTHRPWARAARAHGARHSSAPEEALHLPVGQAPPDPFERAEVEGPQPERADGQLHDPDGGGDEVDLIELQPGVEVQSITEEEKRTDDGMHDVI